MRPRPASSVRLPANIVLVLSVLNISFGVYGTITGRMPTAVNVTNLAIGGFTAGSAAMARLAFAVLAGPGPSLADQYEQWCERRPHISKIISTIAAGIGLAMVMSVSSALWALVT